jgi:hypothetical protein
MAYMGHEEWRDMSEYVVHFTRDSHGRTAYQNQLGILAARSVQARSRFGSAKNLDAVGDLQLAACFSEVPLEMLERLVDRRSVYGVGFHKKTLIAANGGRVWYLDANSTLHDAFRVGGISADDPIWTLAPYVDRVEDDVYYFDWEREWRVAGGLAFTPEEVSFIFAPANLHDAAKAFFETGGGGAGPAYNCPILDPTWPMQAIQEVLGPADG